MSGITDPAEEYFKDGIWGWVTDAWEKLVADASGFLQINIAAQDIDVEVTQDTPDDLRVGLYGWNDGAWRKLTILWGYSSRWAENVIGTAVGAGNALAKTAAVAADYVYRLQYFSINHDAGANKEVLIRVFTNGVTVGLFHDLAVVSGTHYPISVDIALCTGDTVQAVVIAPGDGKVITLRVWGYKMGIG